ncbi:DUF433 domain-containing protein [Fodinicurvata fenggangensis]|uniref:DUF433 domain-containing protein n=1 Tax=Fodinicurvata fenggangensis TaxID=1121830 RepID=UPI00047CC77D|nr:DUF433 domain-containing protein [Fodinicurvata fenggangensis]
MSVRLAHKTDPLLAGFFSISDVARLVGVKSALIRSWLTGYPNSKSGPIVDRDFEGTRTVSFLDLMELRFIAIFRGQGVPMATIRTAAENARRDWQVTHPLALSRAQYVTDRRKVFARVAEKHGDSTTRDLVTGQHEMWDTIEQTIEKGVVFDPKTYLARMWKPRPAEFPSIIINPHVAFGRPTIEGTKVPTTALFQQWKAEGSKARVAKWFDVPPELVSSAIEYELVAA